MIPIYETVVTTVSPRGVVHIAPMGIQHAGDAVLLKPFKPSRTLENVLATGVAVMNLTTDVRVFAGCVTGRHDWPCVPAEVVPCVRLVGALAHVELRLTEMRDDPRRPVLVMSRVGEHTHAPFAGFNRAQAAVLEGAILVSRLSMLPREKLDTEMAYLQIAIDKTAGPPEREAWDWLQRAVADFHREAARSTTE
jgi:hypothetical protein